MKEIELISIPLIEWIGYIASALVLVSLSLSSMLRLRTVNLFGSAIFAFYGFAIGSLPVGIMNLIIFFSNIYYLRKLLFKRDNFEIIETKSDQEYIQKFLTFFEKDIRKIFPHFEFENHKASKVLMIMRNMNLAGLFIAQEKGECLKVELDFVVPQYRDFKTGKFIFAHFKESLKEKNYKIIEASSQVPQQIKYLKKMGFVQDTTAGNEQKYHLHL